MIIETFNGKILSVSDNSIQVSIDTGKKAKVIEKMLNNGHTFKQGMYVEVCIDENKDGLKSILIEPKQAVEPDDVNLDFLK